MWQGHPEARQDKETNNIAQMSLRDGSSDGVAQLKELFSCQDFKTHGSKSVPECASQHWSLDSEAV